MSPPAKMYLLIKASLMSAKIIQGKDIAEKTHQEIADNIKRAKSTAKDLKQTFVPPGLAVILVGHDPASEIYVGNKHRACQQVGISSSAIHLPNDTTQEALLSHIDALNIDPLVHGILVQLPLPPHINSQAIVERIDPNKDVDGFHPYNLGRLAQKFPNLRPCTPAGIMELLKFTQVDLKGLNATVIGTSNIVGRPMLLELLNAGCTTTSCHRLTRSLEQFVLQADILVVAAGHPGLVKGDWIKPGSIAIDVGMNRLDNGRLVGDLDFEGAYKRAAWITPVPGGVGPMTVATLMKNTYLAYCKQVGLAPR